MSGKATPESTAAWTDLIADQNLMLPPPDHVWLLQEGSGSLADSIGSVSLTPDHSPTYGNIIPGWARQAVGTSDTVINQGFLTTSLGNLNGTSYLVLVYLSATTPTAERSLFAIGAEGDHRYVALTTAPFFKATGINVTPVTGTSPPTNSVHPIVLQVNEAAAQYTVYTDQERMRPSWAPTTALGNMFILGNASFGAANARYLYAAMWTGTSATIDDSEVKKLLTALGWSPSGF